MTNERFKDYEYTIHDTKTGERYNLCITDINKETVTRLNELLNNLQKRNTKLKEDQRIIGETLDQIIMEKDKLQEQNNKLEIEKEALKILSCQQLSTNSILMREIDVLQETRDIHRFLRAYDKYVHDCYEKTQKMCKEC